MIRRLPLPCRLAVSLFLAGALQAEAEVSAPAFTPKSSDSAVAMDVAITCATPNATIRYTTNGADPTIHSPQVTNGGEIRIARHSVIKAKAWDGSEASPVTTEDYRITGAATLGYEHGLALSVAGRMWSWGKQSSGRLGNGQTAAANVTTPTQVLLGSGYFGNGAGIAAGYDHSVVIDQDGKVWAFGENGDGQLGDNTTTDSGLPVRVLKSITATDLLDECTEVDAGEHFGIALSADRQVYTWGVQSSGRLGNGTNSSSARKYAGLVKRGDDPAYPELGGIYGIAAGHSFGLAREAHAKEQANGTGKVWVWGHNHVGQLGLGNATGTTRAFPMLLNANTEMTDAYQVSGGGAHSAILRWKEGEADLQGTVWSCGKSDEGRLANGSTASGSVTYPVKALTAANTPLTGIEYISAGTMHTLAVDGDGHVWAWGNNQYGQLGDGTTTHSGYAKMVKDASGTGVLSGIVTVSAGGEGAEGRSLALGADGRIWVWGRNDEGQLGNGVTDNACELPVAHTQNHVDEGTPSVAIAHQILTAVEPGEAELTATPSHSGPEGLDAIDRVAIYLNGVLKATVRATDNWKCNAGALLGGDYHYYAIAYDQEGVAAMSSSGSFTIALDPAADSDTDGLTNGEEATLASDPHNSDTDGDEMGDGWEVFYNMPLLDAAASNSSGTGYNDDPDGDLILNRREYQLGTIPISYLRKRPYPGEVPPKTTVYPIPVPISTWYGKTGYVYFVDWARTEGDDADWTFSGLYYYGTNRRLSVFSVPGVTGVYHIRVRTEPRACTPCTVNMTPKFSSRSPLAEVAVNDTGDPRGVEVTINWKEPGEPIGTFQCGNNPENTFPGFTKPRGNELKPETHFLPRLAKRTFTKTFHAYYYDPCQKQLGKLGPSDTTLGWAFVNGGGGGRAENGDPPDSGLPPNDGLVRPDPPDPNDGPPANDPYNSAESGECETAPSQQECDDTNPDKREEPALEDPEEVEIVAENIRFNHRKHGFPPYTGQPENDKPHFFLTESVTTTMAGGNPESPVGGYIQRKTCRLRGNIIIAEQEGNPSYFGIRSSPDAQKTETTYSGSFEIGSYNDCPNELDDEEATLQVDGELSDPYLTDAVKEDAFEFAWDFKDYFEQTNATAELLLNEDETFLSYQKTQYKVRVPADLPRPYKAVWVERFIPEDEDPDDDVDPEPEYTVKSEEISGAESSIQTIDPSGNPNKEGSWEVFLIRADIDVDSDNNNAKSIPDRTPEEEVAQRHETADAEHPGKMLFAHTGDEDYDGIPDYADGFSDLFETKGIALEGAAEDAATLQGGFIPQGSALVPLAYTTDVAGLSDSDVWIKFEYSESDPAEVDEEREAGSQRAIYKLPQEGALRLWARNCDQNFLRSKNSISQEGDFIPDGEVFRLSDFKERLAALGSTGLYVEAVKPSDQIRSQKIKMKLGVGPEGAPSWGFEEEVHFSALSMGLMSVSESGSATPANGIGLSHPSPVIKLSQCVVSQPRWDSYIAQWVVDIDIAGTVTSKFLDTIPASQGGTITELALYMNNGAEPTMAIPVVAQKGSNPSSLISPFPYTGSFSEHLVGMVAVDGNNVLTLKAKDSVFEINGETEAVYSMDFPEDPPSTDSTTPGGGPGATPQGGSTLQHTETYTLQFVDGLDDETINHASLTTTSSTSAGSSQMDALTETDEDSKIFTIVGTSRFGKIDPDFEPRADAADTLLLTIEDISGQQLAVLLLRETAENSNIYVASVNYWLFSIGGTVPYEAPLSGTTAVVTYQSTGGEFHPYVYGIEGPKDLAQAMTQLSFVDEVAGSSEEPGAVSHQFTANITEIQNKIYLANKAAEQAAAVVAFKENTTEDRFPSVSDEIYAALSKLQTKSLFPENYTDFAKGIGMGLIKGGVDMVGGLGDTVKLGCKAVYEGGKTIIRGGVLALKCIWKTATGQSLEEERRQIQDATAKLDERMKFFRELRDQGPGIVETVLRGDFKKLDELSGSMKTMVSFGAEIFAGLVDQLTGDDYTKGVFWGRAVFEIGAAYFPVAKLGAVAKVQFLDKLKAVRFFQEGPGAAAFAAKANFIAKLRNCAMCFVAGTAVATANGPVPIESIHEGDWVWSRQENGGEVSLRQVKALFKTHPRDLVSLGYDIDGDGQSDDSLTGTPQHPVWSPSRNAFVPLGELSTGDSLQTFDGTAVRIVSLDNQRSPAGTYFTTYNFEVADFHTYFAGRFGIWTHNVGKWCCDYSFSIYEEMKAKHGNRWHAMRMTIHQMRREMKQSSKSFTKAHQRTIYNEVLDDHLANGGNLLDVDDIPGSQPHELPVDRAFRQQGKKVYGNPQESDGVSGNQPDRLIGDEQMRVEYKRIESPQLLAKRIRQAMEKEGTRGFVLDKTLWPDFVDQNLRDAINSFPAGSMTIEKWWVFDGTSLTEFIP